jgi:hypothetical protein
MNTLYNMPPPIKDINKTITEAMQTPIKIAENAHLNRTLKRVAAIHAVHAPVIGKGIATKSINPKNSYLSTRSLRRLVFSKSHLKNLLKGQNLPKNSDTGSSKKSIGITGMRLPRMEKKTTLLISRPIARPSGIAPLSSKTGIAATTITASSFGRQET